MEQVKIFTRGTADKFEQLEQDVNEWLKTNEGIEIISRHVVSSAGVNAVQQGFVNCTIVVFYKTRA